MTGAATLIGGISINETVTGIALGGVSRRGFDICMQDDRSGNTLQFDSCTGDYQFTKCGSGAFVLTGRGITSLQGNVLSLRGDRFSPCSTSIQILRLDRAPQSLEPVAFSRSTTGTRLTIPVVVAE